MSLPSFGGTPAIRSTRDARCGRSAQLHDLGCPTDVTLAPTMSAFTDCAVYGSRRTNGHGNSPCVSASASRAVVATAGGRDEGATSGGEPHGAVWTRAVQIGAWHATRPAWAYVATAMRSPAIAGSRCPCPLICESHQGSPTRLGAPALSGELPARSSSSRTTGNRSMGVAWAPRGGAGPTARNNPVLGLDYSGTLGRSGCSQRCPNQTRPCC